LLTPHQASFAGHRRAGQHRRRPGHCIDL
jgi:hypothetical protein